MKQNLTEIHRWLHSVLSKQERSRGRRLVVWMGFATLLEVLAVGLVLPAVVLVISPGTIDEYLPGIGARVSAWAGSPLNLALLGMAGLVLVYAVKEVIVAAVSWKQAQFAYGLQASLAQRLFCRYMQAPYTFHITRNSAKSLRNVVTEVNQLTLNVILPGTMLMAEVLVVAGMFVLLLMVEPVATLLVGGFLTALGALAFRGSRARMADWGQDRQLHEGARIQHLQQGFGGLKEVQVLGRTEEFLNRHEVHSIRVANSARNLFFMQQLPRLALEWLAVAGLALLVVTLVLQGRAPEEVIPPVGMFAAAAFRVAPSLNRIVAAVQSMRYGLPVLKHLAEEMAEVSPPQANTGPSIPKLTNSLQLRSLHYAYPGERNTGIKEIDLEIARGETIGIAGPSGSGKSTLVDVMLGLLPPSSGSVEVDGRNVRENVPSWQRQVGYVPQAIYLIDDTLRRNIALGVPEAEIDDGVVAEAAGAAMLLPFVATLPMGLETMVGEHGVQLSGGQRQRIGIARALYANPDVLVLDEATSALDYETERSVMETVHNLRGSKTIIIVAHRATSLEGCDRVVYLEQGRIERIDNRHRQEVRE